MDAAGFGLDAAAAEPGLAHAGLTGGKGSTDREAEAWAQGWSVTADSIARVAFPGLFVAAKVLAG